MIGSIGNGAIQLVKLAGEYTIQFGSNIGNWLSVNRDVATFVVSQVLGAGLIACSQTGFGSAGGPWGIAACGATLGAYIAFTRWYIRDADSDFEVAIRAINSIPLGRPGVTIAKAIFDGISSAVEPDPVISR